MVSIYDLAKDGTLTEVTLRGLAWSKPPFFSDKTQLTPNGNRQGLPPISRWRRARFAGRHSCPPSRMGA
ncbi:hypothetical protein MY10362_005980 [Beauveria mimosiformis]